jgi:hypothetical protein
MSFKPAHASSFAILSQAASGPESSARVLIALSITPVLTTLNWSLSNLDASQLAKLLGGEEKFAIREAEPKIFANCEDVNDFNVGSYNAFSN